MNKKAFTLVELIVVITILAVLATVAFISFQGYAVSSRDSARLADLTSMQKVLELYNVKNSKYPNPDSGTNITYSGSLAWTQGVFGISAYTDSSSMSNVPVDPVTGLEYPYSRTVSAKEYSLAAILEQPVSSKLANNTFAGTQVATVLVKGNYNGKILKVRKNAITYILGVPSILTSYIESSTTLEDIITRQDFVYNGRKNLPASFSGSVYDTNPTSGFDFGGSTYLNNKVVLFKGNLDTLKNNQVDRVTFLGKLQNSYSGSIIASETGISDLLAVDSTSNVASSNYVATVLNNSLKMNITVVASTNGTTLYPSGCDQPDITVGLYTIASCNAGTSITGTGNESYGGLYQWGNNFNFRGNQFVDGSVYIPNIVGPVGLASTTFIINSVSPNDWITPQDDNLWGDVTNTNIARQGACSSGYHIPTQTEWSGIVAAGGWGATDGIIMSGDLQLPLAGGRYRTDATIGLVGVNGYYWSSSQSTTAGYSLHFTSTTILPESTTTRAYGFSVRCFKN